MRQGGKVMLQTLETGNDETGDGYTLLELIIVLSIIAALFAVGLSRVAGSGSSTAEFMSISSALHADLVKSQAMARMSGRTSVFRVSPNKLAYSFASEESEVNLPEGFSMTINSASAGGNADQPETIEFYSWGGASGGIVVLNDASKQVEYEVDWLTGGVRLMRE